MFNRAFLSPFRLGSLFLAMTLPALPTAAETETSTGFKLPPVAISEALTIPRHSIDLLGTTMSYLEIGEGPPVLFVHGNPTSAYLWRNVIPHVADNHRVIAVDLIGMGASGKPDIAYSFADHYRYLAAFIDAFDFDELTLVGHDWGAALTWNYARLNPEKTQRLAFMEGVLPPTFPRPSFASMGEEMGGMFQAFKDEKKGHEMVIENNLFVEEVLPGFINRPLGAEARRVYGEPYLEERDRKPTLAWPREVPIAGEPASSVALMRDIEAFMAETDMPVLLAYAEPGVLIPPDAVDWYTQRIARLETSFIGQGLHFIQEDQPHAIGRALADWLRRTR